MKDNLILNQIFGLLTFNYLGVVCNLGEEFTNRKYTGCQFYFILWIVLLSDYLVIFVTLIFDKVENSLINAMLCLGV